jgi:transposase
MGNVLKMAKQQIIQGYVGLGWSNRAIHRATGIHRDTISGYRSRFENGPKVTADPGGALTQTGPKVFADSGAADGQNRPKVTAEDIALPRTNSRQIFPHRRLIRDKYLLGLTAQRIYQDLVEEVEYSGCYESVKRYVRKLRKKVVRYYERLPVIVGREAQIDFGKAPCDVLREGGYQRPWLFKMTLSFSRHSYEETVWKQDIETFLRCIERGFLSFGGVTETLKLDNLKSGVIRACLYEPDINPVLMAFAMHYGFVPNPCAPRKPEHKGRVERDIGYTKDNALKGRRFESLEEANLFLRHWNKRWARTRIHGSTRQQVWKVFVESEKPHLKALPERPFAFFKVACRKVDVHGHVEVGSCFYSVPHRYIGEKLTVHYSQQWVRVFEGAQLLVQHRPLNKKGTWVTLPGHKPDYIPLSREEAEGWQVTKAKQVGPSCHRLVYRILCSDHPLAIRKTRGILALARKFDRALLDQACQYALTTSQHTYRAVARRCEMLRGLQPNHSPVLTQQDEVIRQMDVYHNLVENRSTP